MAGSISLSLSQQFDENGSPLAGGKLYFFEAGTVATPQDAFQDYDLTIEHPNPIILDDAGRVPAFYLDDGFIKVRLTSATGLEQVVADNLLVVGPSSGSGGGGGVDATTIASTGDMKVRYSTGTHAGWVRANGRTIGSATSSATERANADTEALFTHLYNADVNLTVSGGRGANAAADFAANKTIALPDWRGRALAGLDDMGNSAAGRLTSSYFGTAATALGAAGGSQSHTLLEDELPTVSVTSGAGSAHSHGLSTNSLDSQAVAAGGASRAFSIAVNNNPIVQGGSGSFGTSENESSHTHTVAFGDDDPHNNVPPTMLATIFIKL